LYNNSKDKGRKAHKFKANSSGSSLHHGNSTFPIRRRRIRRRKEDDETRLAIDLRLRGIATSARWFIRKSFISPFG
jgi:hypothetical protein